MTDDLPHRRVYAKGYYDGLRAAGVTDADEMPFMNAKKFDSVYNGLTSVARKVFDVTPISEKWAVDKIVSELSRRGSRVDHRVVMGALRDLCGRKLVVETSTGLFQRASIEHKPKPVEAKAMAEPKAAAEAKKSAEIVTLKSQPAKKGPMELLADLASKARTFAEELDNAALEIEQEFQNSEAKSEQLKQLKSLLKGITD